MGSLETGTIFLEDDMPSRVYFTDLRASLKRGLMDKIADLMEQVGLAESQKKNGLSAIKLHFGEKGNTAFIRPVHVRPFVDAIKAAGAKPFITDCNTLYVGQRADSVNHLTTATENGFAYSVVNAPLIIADGLTGQDCREVDLGYEDADKAWIGTAIAEADSLVSLAHFKGHELTGFGGTLKNLGMGCGSRRGKLYMHSMVSPEVDQKLCIACGQCIKRCPVGAIKFEKLADGAEASAKSERPGYAAVKNIEKCIGCGDCILACPTEAMQIQWDAQVPILMRRMVGHAAAAIKGKEGRRVFFNFITQVSPACDCYPFQDAPIVADIGIAASKDPVALDQASVDLVNQATGMPGSCLKSAHQPGADKFKDVYPDIDWEYQLSFAEDVGMGSRAYDLVRI